MSEVTIMRRIAAAPATVFSFFTDAERWISWQGVDGVVDAQPGVAALADLRRGEQAFRQGDGTWLRLPRDRPGLDVPRQWR